MKPTDTHDSSACVESGLSILKLIHLSSVSLTHSASSSSPSFPFPSSPESIQTGVQYRGRSPGPVILCSTCLLSLALCLLCCLLLTSLPRAILHSFTPSLLCLYCPVIIVCARPCIHSPLLYRKSSLAALSTLTLLDLSIHVFFFFFSLSFFWQSAASSSFEQLDTHQCWLTNILSTKS